MRTLRLALTGVVALALLGGLGGAVLAQDDAEVPTESGEVMAFEGTMSYRNPDIVYLDMGTVESIPPEGKTLIQKSRGLTTESRLEDISDSRLAGTFREAQNRDSYMPGSVTRVWTSAIRIDNADGAWLGHATGYNDTEPFPSLWYSQGIMAGTGAYEGLNAVIFIEDMGTGDRRVHGLVFPGVLPEVPDYPEPDAE